jgi:hypothetical protein
LGTLRDSLYKQIKSKSLPFEKFTSSYLISDIKQLLDINNSKSYYYTNVFNSFENQSKEHIGLLYPIILNGTDNIFGVDVLLGHTKIPVLLGNSKKYEYKNTIKCFKQSVNEKLIEQIKEMYTTKYGSPKLDYSSEANIFFIFNKDRIEEKHSNEFKAKIITWETEYLTITFFTGFRNHFEGCYYMPLNKFYLDVSFPNEVIDYKNRMDCYAYPYIEYRLNAKAIEELQLEKSASI